MHGRTQVDRVASSAPDEPHGAESLFPRGARIGRAQDSDVPTAGAHGPRHPLDVHLRATPLRVAPVAPREEQDARPWAGLRVSTHGAVLRRFGPAGRAGVGRSGYWGRA